MIQIDMQMPEACDVCPFNYDFCWCKAFGNHDEWEKYSNDWNDNVCDRETRPGYCPLKEQEPVEPKQVGLYGKDEWWGLVCVCPDCKAEWMSDKADTHFCPKCGQVVKWE